MAIAEALIYISAFVVYGAVLVYPGEQASTLERLNFLSDNYLLLSVINLVSYVLFGILLAVLVLAIHQKLRAQSPVLSSLAAVFGYIWVGLVMASGMIANIALTTVTNLGVEDPEGALLIWKSVGIVSEGLGGGNEIVGGLWLILLSVAALRGKVFSKVVHVLGIVVGTAGVLTIYPLEVFTEIFGLGQIVWFLWIGILMIRRP